MRLWKTGILAIFLLLGFVGCESTISDNGAVSIKAGSNGTDESALGTLAVDSADIPKLLQSAPWSGVECSIATLYDDDAYPKPVHTYPVDLLFERKKVVAFADCQKITANYRIVDKEISFWNIDVAPAVELAVCEESEYADDAVLAMLNNRFTVAKIGAKTVELSAIDYDTSVILKR